MSKDQGLTRREFTVASALAMLSGVVITISPSACGGSYSPSTPSPTPTPPASGDEVGVISANHGHIATIAGATLAAGNAYSFDIRGGADHPHTVSLSAAEIVSIAANQRVSKESSTDLSHSHTVTFN